MANRRMGGMGMGGGPRGNRSFSQQPFQGSGLNPWQGAMPQNSMNQGLISQISSNPQQLALALTSLLQNQQQNPPSLLSLPTPPVFSNQGGDFNRFGNRGRDFRRHEPYNKNRNAGGQNRNNDNNRRRGNNNQNQRKRFDDKDQKKAAEKKEDKAVDLSTDDGGEEKSSKRDWKDEKNISEEKKAEGEDGQKGNKDGPYAGIPKEYLNCFVCNKQMWDGESMHKHVKGRAHRQTLETIEESIHITVNILRENMRLLEEKKVIELERVQRLTKKYNKFQEPESHCNMCDLKFLGKIVNHRKNEGHQRLKRYLHPVCNLCDKEFPSRVEWMEHRLTPEHLKNISEKMKNKCGGADGDIIINEDDEQDLELEPLLEEPLQMEDDNPILELTDDLTSIQNLMPAYKPTRAVSTQSLVEFTGFRCELCTRSFKNEDLAQNHLKTKRHYHSFIEAVKKKYKEQQKAKEIKKAEEEKVEKEKEESQGDGDQEMYDPEEATNEDDSAMDGETTQEEETEGDPSVINNTADMLEMIEDEGADEEVEPEEEETPEPPPPPKKEEVKIEPAKPVTSTPKQQTPAAKAAPAAAAKTAPVAAAKPAPVAAAKPVPVAAAATGVKNGAGPKSKKARKQ